MDVKIGQQGEELLFSPSQINTRNNNFVTETPAGNLIQSMRGLPNYVVKLKDYAYVTVFNDIDYDYADRYFRTHTNHVMGGCSSVRSGDIVGRQFDWKYNRQCSFVTFTSRSKGRYASLGMSGSIPALTNNFVQGNEFSDIYKLIPFQLTDGVNEHRLYCNANVVPFLSNSTRHSGKIDNEVSVCGIMLPRFILDNFTSATEAVEYVRDHCEVYIPESFRNDGYDLHFMIADSNSSTTYIIEFIGNETVILDVSDSAWMTNFHRSGVTLNADGTVYTPQDVLSGHLPSECGISAMGTGLERFNIIANNYSSVTDMDSMRSLLNRIMYTNAYKDSTNPFWYSEFVMDSVTVDSPPQAFEKIVEVGKELFNNRTRDDKLATWQTVHSAVYDIKNKQLKVVFQEDGEELGFSLTLDAMGQITTAGGSGGDSMWEAGTGLNSAILKNSESKAFGDHSISYGYRCLSHGNCSSTRGVASDTSSPNDSGAIPEWRDGYAADASGHLTIAGGRASHTEGNNTLTNNPSEHAEGQYNVSHINGDTPHYGDPLNTQHSVGIGSEFDRKNAFEIMQNGDAYMIGVGGYDGTNPGTASTVQDCIGGGSSGLITLAKNIDLTYQEESTEKDSYFTAVCNVTPPSDFANNPYRYNLIVEVHGAVDSMLFGYTANHFCYLSGDDLNGLMAQCADVITASLSGSDSDTTHFTHVNITSGGILDLSYKGLMGDYKALPETGSKVSVYLQPLY